MIVANDVVKDVIAKVMRDNKHPQRQDIESIVYRVLESIGVNIGGKTARRMGYITGINHSLMLLVQESDGAKVVPLKPGMIVEIATDDYDHPYLSAKVVAAPADSPYIQMLEGPEIDPATTPIVGSYARTVVQIGVTDPPNKQLSTDPQVSQLNGPDEPEKVVHNGPLLESD